MSVKSQANDVRAALMLRIADSASFRRAPKLRELFLYICRNSLEGRDHLLSEQQIGEHVFGREPAYNPAEDSIVRAQVRLLRRKLDAWFADEGRDEALRLTIPRGAYVPVWVEAEAPPATEVLPPGPASPTASQSPPAAMVAGQRRWTVAVAIVVAFLAGWWLSPRAAPVPRSHPILSSLFDNRHPILLVLQDASLTLINNSLRTAIPLSQYQNLEYKQLLANPAFDPEYRKLLQIIDGRQYTSVGDVAILRHLLAVFPPQVQRIEVASARHLHPRHLKNANVVLVGGTVANPWLELYEGSLAFRLVRSGDGRLAVENLHPRNGERQSYVSDDENGYGLLAALPNTDGSGSVLVLAGTILEATEAAGETVLSWDKAAEFARKLRDAAGRDVRYFQAIVRTRRVKGIASTSDVVALRAK